MVRKRVASVVLLLLVGACAPTGPTYVGYDAAPGGNPGWPVPNPGGWGCSSRTAQSDMICNDDEGDVYCQTGLWTADNKGEVAAIVPCDQAILCPPQQPDAAGHPACQGD